ncbi:hypothetical protein [Lactiplantibacillus carotarum]|uniref:hypothetical protein n=1 Tax=Lactiplantibacillus carotarum TaxID=2993456 RepID=UPI00298EEA6B|nr:hypothetical protein [Lactiplantibacillus carotarum]
MLTKIKRWAKLSLALFGGIVALTLLWPINGLAASPLTSAFTAVDSNSTTYSSGKTTLVGRATLAVVIRTAFKRFR